MQWPAGSRSVTSSNERARHQAEPVRPVASTMWPPNNGTTTRCTLLTASLCSESWVSLRCTTFRRSSDPQVARPGLARQPVKWRSMSERSVRCPHRVPDVASGCFRLTSELESVTISAPTWLAPWTLPELRYQVRLTARTDDLDKTFSTRSRILTWPNTAGPDREWLRKHAGPTWRWLRRLCLTNRW